MKHLSHPIKLGIFLGLLFFAHALVPNSNAWPLIWPIIAGSMAVWLPARKGRVQGFWRGVSAAAKAGAVAGALFFLTTAVALWLLSNRSFEPVARQLGSDGPVDLSLPVFFGIAVAALIGTALAALSGAATYPLVRGTSKSAQR